MTLRLLQKNVGPWPMHTYLLVCPDTQKSAIVDPGADGEKILELAAGTSIEKILITHGHFDHVGALDFVKAATNAPVYIHPADGEKFAIQYEQPLDHKMELRLGDHRIIALHTPGHTPGMTSFDLLDGRVLVGDTIFVGGPGKTWSPEEFRITMQTMQKIVFAWPDRTEFFPGHGPSGKIGIERPAYDAFRIRGWSDTLFGDVTWH